LLAAAVVTILVSGVATACSSSSSTGAAGSGTTGANATQGKTITLGILTPLTGPVASSFGQATIQGAQARIQELEAQVAKMRGVTPTVRDRGADVPAPGSPPSGGLSSNGDFVKSLVSKFQKETGL